MGIAKWLAVSLTLVFFGCGEKWVYLAEQAPGQISLLIGREPIEKVLKEKELATETRYKLEKVLDIKSYAENEIGLVKNKSYTLYKEIDREALVYNLTACPKLSLKPLKWKFPLVGTVPYLGFFKKEDAKKKQKELEEKGYDVYVRTAGAYSMLGIVSDPLYSTMLKWSIGDLANTIIHELTHATVWSKSYPDFNENFALFIGNQGSLEYCISRFGKDSKEVEETIGSNFDDQLFSQYISEISRELEEFYARKDLSDEEKLKMREDIFKAFKEKFKKDYLPKMKTKNYAKWLDLNLNNAVIASRRVYFHDLSLYYDVYSALGSSLQKMVELGKKAVNSGIDPELYLKKFLNEETSIKER